MDDLGGDTSGKERTSDPGFYQVDHGLEKDTGAVDSDSLCGGGDRKGNQFQDSLETGDKSIEYQMEEGCDDMVTIDFIDLVMNLR